MGKSGGGWPEKRGGVVVAAGLVGGAMGFSRSSVAEGLEAARLSVIDFIRWVSVRASDAGLVGGCGFGW